MISLRTVLVLSFASMAVAQIPSFGWCPEYAAMPDFEMSRYMGVWHEAERYFSVLEVGSRCVTTNYTKALDGKYHVSNQITNRLTGIKRILDGEMRSVGKAGEGKLTVKYTTLPVSFDTTFSVLETDYDTFSVLWSCSSLGPAPVNTQNAWVMTRERLAPGAVLQRAYGVLDKYKISRTFFVKTDQADCAILEANSENDEAVVAPVEEEGSVRGAAVPAAVHVAQVVDPNLSVVKHDEPVVGVVDTPSEAMLPPAPLKVADVGKGEVVDPLPVVVDKVVPEVEAPAKIVEPLVDAVKAEPAVEKVDPIAPQVPGKVAAKSHLKKKTHQV